MKYAIQRNLINQIDLDQIINSLRRNNMEYVLIDIIPFTDNIITDTPMSGLDYFPYGSTKLTNIAYSLGWSGLYFDQKTFNYGAAVANRDDMLNNNVMSIRSAIDFFKSEIYSGNGETSWFVRPSDDLKHFTGDVVTSKNGHAWFLDMLECASSGSYKLEDDTMVVVSEPVTIYSETRCFVIDGKIIDASLYRNHGQLFKRRVTENIPYYQEFADKWLPSPCCVMDIADTSNGVKVVEFNCLNSSGMYSCDIDHIFSEVNKYHTRNG